MVKTSSIVSAIFVLVLVFLLSSVSVCCELHNRLKELSDKISKQGLGSPSVLRNVVVKEVVIGLSYMAFLLQVIVKFVLQYRYVFALSCNMV